nr:immunoglobulin heavy chain junction region [Macaca mulatta]MOW87834.1 immunoglobulin heavy chain junction region [Macaca mulatta]MOW88426.1 immunoglobulin heavy chain junction region [Macaca mulatta]MOW89115.1 immunoglobulin heavy chain junction region [Macaca mulatta]MOW89224.1 immunoglobulin heavy chain junction region [Macaca mulatta]
CARGSKGFDYW